MTAEELLSGENGATGIGSDLTSSVNDMLAPFIWLSVLLTIVFIVLYVSSIVRRRKVENAILDIQKTLHEMNEREKARLTPPRPQPLSEKNNVIAQTTNKRSDTTSQS